MAKRERISVCYKKWEDILQACWFFACSHRNNVWFIELYIHTCVSFAQTVQPKKKPFVSKPWIAIKTQMPPYQAGGVGLQVSPPHCKSGLPGREHIHHCRPRRIPCENRAYTHSHLCPPEALSQYPLCILYPVNDKNAPLNKKPENVEVLTKRTLPLSRHSIIFYNKWMTNNGIVKQNGHNWIRTGDLLLIRQML